MCKRTPIYYVLQTVFKHILPKNIKLSFKVDGYVKNGGKKNETDSRLDCYHNWPVKPVLTLQYVSVGFPSNVYVENILLEDRNSRTTH